MCKSVIKYEGVHLHKQMQLLVPKTKKYSRLYQNNNESNEHSLDFHNNPSSSYPMRFIPVCKMTDSANSLI